MGDGAWLPRPSTPWGAWDTWTPCPEAGAGGTWGCIPLPKLVSMPISLMYQPDGLSVSLLSGCIIIIIIIIIIIVIIKGVYILLQPPTPNIVKYGLSCRLEVMPQLNTLFPQELPVGRGGPFHPRGPRVVWAPGALSRRAFECLGREEEGRWGPRGLAVLTVVFVTTSGKPTGNPRPPAVTALFHLLSSLQNGRGPRVQRRLQAEEETRKRRLLPAAVGFPGREGFCLHQGEPPRPGCFSLFVFV